MSARIRVEVDRVLCAGYANCLDVAPEVFDLDDHDIAIVREADYDGDQRELLVSAARRCPAKAIALVDMAPEDDGPDRSDDGAGDAG